MICPECNHDIPEGMKFCPNCGNPLPQKRVCPNCGKELKEDMMFCNNCGTKVSDNSELKPQNVSNNTTSDIICPICGTQLSIDDQQCPNCHRSLFYHCNSCNHDITYGEIIKSNGTCPNCGIRLTSLFNIPNDKYPFYQPQIESNNQLPQNDDEDFEKLWSKITKIGKYILSVCGLIVIIFYAINFFNPTSKLESKGEDAILNVLKAPSTAKFLGTVEPDKTKDYVEKTVQIQIPKDCAVMAFKVEAENGFGGRVTDTYVVFYQNGEPLGVIPENDLIGEGLIMLATWGWIPGGAEGANQKAQEISRSL